MQFVFVLNCQSVVPQGISLFGRPERSYHPKARHFAVVDAILYPPKVSSERPIDDVPSGERCRWNDPKVTLFILSGLYAAA